MSKIGIIAKLTARPGKTEAFEAQTIGVCKAVAENEPENIFYHLCKGAGPNDFIAFELYENKAAVDAHGQSAHIAATRDTVPDLIEPEMDVDILTQVY